MDFAPEILLWIALHACMFFPLRSGSNDKRKLRGRLNVPHLKVAPILLQFGVDPYLRTVRLRCIRPLPLQRHSAPK